MKEKKQRKNKIKISITYIFKKKIVLKRTKNNVGRCHSNTNTKKKKSLKLYVLCKLYGKITTFNIYTDPKTKVI